MEVDLVDDGLNDVAIIKLETQDAILDMFSKCNLPYCGIWRE